MTNPQPAPGGEEEASEGSVSAAQEAVERHRAEAEFKFDEAFSAYDRRGGQTFSSTDLLLAALFHSTMANGVLLQQLADQLDVLEDVKEKIDDLVGAEQFEKAATDIYDQIPLYSGLQRAMENAVRNSIKPGYSY